MSCSFFGALGLPLPSYTCIRQTAVQVELVRACIEAGECDSVSTRAVHPLCFTGVCFLLFIIHLLSRVFVLSMSEMFSHWHQPQCCVIRLCSRAVCAMLRWEKIQGCSCSKALRFCKARDFPVLSLLPQHLAYSLLHG